MNKKDALAFIKLETEKGTPQGDIVEVLMSQDKLGTAKPSEDIVMTLFKEALEPVFNPSDLKCDPKPSGCNWEKWNMRIVRDERGNIKELVKTFKMKDVRIDDEVAERMNRATLTSEKGHAVRYFKKQDV